MARFHYQQDAELSPNGGDFSKVYFSADLQKVVLLPRLDMFKIIIFCLRITAFNESFVFLGGLSTEKSYALLWHEGISERKKKNIISAYRNFFESKRDCFEITIWTDNCTGQHANSGKKNVKYSPWMFRTFTSMNIIHLNINKKKTR